MAIFKELAPFSFSSLAVASVIMRLAFATGLSRSVRSELFNIHDWIREIEEIQGPVPSLPKLT
jgi:hypothetical protein